MSSPGPPRYAVEPLPPSDDEEEAVDEYLRAQYTERFNVPPEEAPSNSDMIRQSRNNVIVATPPYRLNDAIRKKLYMADGPVVLKIPEGAEFIGRDAFKGCTKVTVLELPASLKRIDSGAFEELSNLRTVRFFGPPPEIHDDAFDYYSTVEFVQCPEGHSEIYEAISDTFFDNAPVIPKLRIRRIRRRGEGNVAFGFNPDQVEAEAREAGPNPGGVTSTFRDLC